MASEEQGDTGTEDDARTDTERDTERDSDAERDGEGGERVGLDRSDDTQSFVDQSKIDFDPDDGVYSGTAVDGTSEIPGPHLESESGELSPEDLQREAAQQAEEAGVSPDDTPAAKSPVAKAAEQAREDGEPDGGGGQ
jgi:hypothetical protein